MSTNQKGMFKKYLVFALKCMAIGMIAFGTLSFYSTVISFNSRIATLEDIEDELLWRLSALENHVYARPRD